MSRSGNCDLYLDTVLGSAQALLALNWFRFFAVPCVLFWVQWALDFLAAVCIQVGTVNKKNPTLGHITWQASVDHNIWNSCGFVCKTGQSALDVFTEVGRDPIGYHFTFV
jgi:hypothetical protein